jgi:hypothetical protein
MARLRWIVVGAAAATGVLVVAPSAYQRLRTAIGPSQQPELPAADEAAQAATAAEPASTPPPAAAFATYDPPPAATAPPVSDDDTAELRLRIDETRDRIRRRVQESPTDEPA